MQAYCLGQSVVRFQNTLRPSSQCQCSTSFAARPAPSHTRSVAVVQSSSTGSSAIDDPSSQGAPQQPVVVQQSHQQQPPAPAQPSWQQQRRGPPRNKGQPVMRGKPWDYKYKWQPCPSVCAHGDERCYKVEALIQNVLSYPNMPPRICKYLPQLNADLASVTGLVEQMASHFGKELTLIYITKWPVLLELDFSTLLARIKGFRELFGVLDSDVPMLLRKFPGLVVLEPQELRARYDNLRDITRFNNVQMRAFVLKFPLAFSYQPANVRAWVERFQQLCFTREEWSREYQLAMTPSLMAFFLKDAGDQLRRFEYLASTGERPDWGLRDVMKPADKSFRAKTKNFAVWEQRVKARKAQQRAAAKAAALQQQQAEADAIKAAILADDDGQQQVEQQQGAQAAANMFQQQQQQPPVWPSQQQQWPEQQQGQGGAQQLQRPLRQ